MNFIIPKTDKLIKKGVLCLRSKRISQVLWTASPLCYKTTTERKANVVKLEWSDVLYEICKVRAKEIVDEFSHTKLDSTAKNVLKNKYGYEEWMLWGNVGTKGYGVCIISGENIFSGSSSPNMQ